MALRNYQLLKEMLSRGPSGDACLVWPRGKNGDGYGALMINYKNFKAHRLAYELTIGSIPNGLQVLHSCDNPPCFRPSHLFLGTNLDNVRDKHSKGRQRFARGIGCTQAKLTDEKVAFARDAHREGVTATALAIQFGVSRSTVKLAIRGHTWAHVPDGQSTVSTQLAADLVACVERCAGLNGSREGK